MTKSLVFATLLGLSCAEDDKSADTGGSALEDGSGMEDICAGDKKTARVNGRDISEVGDPQVGDEWTVLMICDGTIIMGAYVLRFTPPEVAEVDSVTSEIVFVQEGPATMTLQAGNRTLSHDLTVLPAS